MFSVIHTIWQHGNTITEMFEIVRGGVGVHALPNIMSFLAYQGISKNFSVEGGMKEN
jgi:hypothetical protein